MAFSLCTLLVACGGGSGSGSNVNGTDSSPGATRSSFTLRLTDAPIDNVAAVEMRFIEVGVRKTDGSWIDFPLDSPITIDLLRLQGLLTADLLVDIPLGAGHYNEIRLLVDDAPMSSNIKLQDGSFVELNVPSGRSSGLKIKGDFMIFKTQPTTLVVDIDLRRSIKSPGKSGKYNFKPTLRLVDDTRAGHLFGIVDSNRLFSITEVDPITTAVIKFDQTQLKYKYQAAYLPGDDHTIAITCNANLDDLDSGADDLKFFGIRNVSVKVSNTLVL